MQKVRVRFAPSPTGEMHIGNVRIALFNYLFANQRSGSFVLRIEDTDRARNIESMGLAIVNDLKWLGLIFDEGPVVGGDFGPYIQSQRGAIYQEKLDDLINNQEAYRCFCSLDRLEEMRKKQLSVGLPPRYDRACLALSNDMIKQKIASNLPFIWRFKVDVDRLVEAKTVSGDTLQFELAHITDFAITRTDGSFTFIFANFVDDWTQEVSHVIRGEDHVSNTIMQLALYDSFALIAPVFLHLPFIVNWEGKKLSKRDSGFSLTDLKKAGFLPQAICNYLAIVGGSFDQEIQSLQELASSMEFSSLHRSGSIKYDKQKLEWINHKWINKLETEVLLKAAKPFIVDKYRQAANVSDQKLSFLISKVKESARLLDDFPKLLGFCFEKPSISKDEIDREIGREKAKRAHALILNNIAKLPQVDLFLDLIKSQSKESNIPVGDLFKLFRYLLTGEFKGISMHDLLAMIDIDELEKRVTGF